MSNDENRNTGSGGPSTSVITKVKPKTKRPNLYRVLILNDDYTPMEFVVDVLQHIFQKTRDEATEIEIFLSEGEILSPDFYSEVLSSSDYGVFAVEEGDGSFAVTVVPWSAVRKVATRKLGHLSEELFN